MIYYFLDRSFLENLELVESVEFDWGKIKIKKQKYAKRKYTLFCKEGGVITYGFCRGGFFVFS